MFKLLILLTFLSNTALAGFKAQIGADFVSRQASFMTNEDVANINDYDRFNIRGLIGYDFGIADNTKIGVQASSSTNNSQRVDLNIVRNVRNTPFSVMAGPSLNFMDNSSGYGFNVGADIGLSKKVYLNLNNNFSKMDYGNENTMSMGIGFKF